MSSRVDSPANLFPMPENGGGETMTVTSGRKCSALLTKSGPLGLSVRMLLESPLWWKEGYSLTWEASPLSSRRVTSFTDTNLTSPSPSNASAKTLRVLDTPSSRCLFRLRLSVRPTEETGSSSSHTMMLITPTTVQISDPPEKMKERKERNGYRNGTTFTSLETQVKYDPKVQGLIRTPSAMDARNWEHSEYTGGRTLAQEIVQNEKYKSLLPTPTVIQGGPNKIEDGKRVYHKDKKGGGFSAQLQDLAVSGLLPTPRANSAMGTLPTPSARDWKGKTTPGVRKQSGCVYGEMLPDAIGRMTQDSCPNTDGQSFRLSPLFTEEMMGFPFLWTTLPFLKQDGDLNPSRHTEMQSSLK